MVRVNGCSRQRPPLSRGLYPEPIDLTKTGSEVRDVIGAAQVVVQTNRLKVAKDLELGATLVGDLLGFDPKPAARGLDLRGGRNSDLVLALAVALWWGDDLTWGDDGVDISPFSRRSGSERSWMST